MAGQAKSLAEIEADMKKATLNSSDGGDSPAHPGSGPGTPASTGSQSGGGGLPPSLMFAASQGPGGSPSKGDQSAFNSFIATMKASGGLSLAEVSQISNIIKQVSRM